MEPRVLINEVEGEGPPLVFLPGGLSGYQGWQPVTDALKPERTTVRIQLINNELGQKGEIGQPGLTLDVERDSILLTLDELGLEEPVDMAGWSWGGRAALTSPAPTWDESGPWRWSSRRHGGCRSTRSAMRPWAT